LIRKFLQLTVILNGRQGLGWFLVLWVCFFFSFQYNKVLFQEPFGMHQGAQTDRASIAYSFYKKDPNILEPRVMETRISDGVCGTEFPLFICLGSLFYRVFGYHIFWFRFLVYLLFSLGALAAWRFSALYIQKVLWRIVNMVLWVCMPILTFYASTTVPDAAGIGLLLIAWYYFFQYYYHEKKLYLLYCMLAFTAVGLIKPTLLLGLGVIWGLIIVQSLKWEDFRINKWPVLGWSIIPIGVSAAWIAYSKNLSLKMGNHHFLQGIKLPDTSAEFFENIRYGFSVWDESMYGAWGTYVLLIGLLLPLLKKGQSSELQLIRYIALIYAAVCMLIFGLFNVQFRYHDYYYIIFTPYILFASLYLIAQYIQTRTEIISGTRLLVYFGTLYMALFSFRNTLNLQDRRLTPGDYYFQDVHPGMTELIRIAPQIEALIPEDKEVIVALDVTPCAMLYAIKRYGMRWPDWEGDFVAESLNSGKYSYILVNDVKAFVQKSMPLAEKPPKLLFQEGIWYLYQIH
jgi:hypothetical protein